MRVSKSGYFSDGTFPDISVSSSSGRAVEGDCRYLVITLNSRERAPTGEDECGEGVRGVWCVCY